MFLTGTIFLEEEFLISYQECEEIVRSFPSSFRLVPHNVSGIPPTLRLTMLPECEENVSLNKDAYSVIVPICQSLFCLRIYAFGRSKAMSVRNSEKLNIYGMFPLGKV